MKLHCWTVMWLVLLLPAIVQLEKAKLKNTLKNGEIIKPPYTLKNKHYEVVFPKRINAKLQHVTHAMRHSYPEGAPPSAEDSDEDLHISVPIKGSEKHVVLRPSRRIHSPNMIVETFKHPQRSDLRRHKNRRCHFVGKVHGHRHSRAALSLCDGLAGYIQTDGELFMIEPKYMRDHSADTPHPHIVYQHQPDEGNLFCSMPAQMDPSVKRRRIVERADQSAPKSFPTVLHVETLLVLDQSLLHFHKDVDIENYVLTVFNIAHDLFHDSSLGLNINLAVVRLIRLEVEDHEMNVAVTHNIDKAMQYFRTWQRKINPKEDTHPNHHDLAILLTRIDMCNDDKTCGFMGAAQLGGMCDPDNQAIIAQDNGLLLGYTIAHEIGHTLNLLHDISTESLKDLSHRQETLLHTVMSPHISSHMVEWSNCSRTRLKDFIDYGFGMCLYDPPTEHSFKLADTLPGVMYDGDYQCKSLLGPNAVTCSTGMECENLMCYLDGKGCIETHMRAADGTTCDEYKWCFHGECVELGERPKAVHGGWGQWSEWTECTRTCGSGVASQTRTCDNPTPKFGGKYCEGGSVRYKICTTEPCDLDQPSFRDLQCAEFNSWLYPGDSQIHRWRSYPVRDENPCALYCITENGFIASLRPRVIDGTTCYRGIRDICINGLCKEIPCDLDLQSTAVEDRCGVCKGDGTSCDVEHGNHDLLVTEGVDAERTILVIPRGAVNIKVEEMFPSETRIQVRDGTGMNIMIDGNQLGMFNVYGSKAWVGMIRSRQEAISIQGPLKDNITIWAHILQNSTMKYSYASPAKKKRTPAFYWDYLDWSSCSTECGPGIQGSVAKCVERESGIVDESYCKNITRPKEQMRPCEIAPCVPRWFVGDWGECQHCPFGMRTRIVKCYKPVGTGEGELDFIADYHCANNKPKAAEFCSCKRSKRDEPTPVAAATNEESTVPSASESVAVTRGAEESTVPPASDPVVSETSAAPQGAEAKSEGSENMEATPSVEVSSVAAVSGGAGADVNAEVSAVSEALNATTEPASPTDSTEPVTFTIESVNGTAVGEVATTTEPGAKPTTATTPIEMQLGNFSDVNFTSTITPTVTTPVVKTVLDFIDVNNFKLAVHSDLDASKPADVRKKNETILELTDTDALKFINTAEQETGKNRTKI